MLQVRQLPHIPLYNTLHLFLENAFGLYFCHYFLLIKLYPCNYLSKECGLYKASVLLLEDHVCEKSDAVQVLPSAISCRLHYSIY